jgi:indoleamine 2,3-dioxygenase
MFRLISHHSKHLTRSTVGTTTTLRTITTSANIKRTMASHAPSTTTTTTDTLHLSSTEDDPSLPQFIVGTRNGFLPRQLPLTQLPPQFSKLEELLQKMPLTLADGSKGLLAEGKFGEMVDKELEVVDIDGIEDSRTLTGKLFVHSIKHISYPLIPPPTHLQKTKQTC